jgi:3-phytase
MVVILILVLALTAGGCRQAAEPPAPAAVESPAPTPPPFDSLERLDPRLVADLKRVPEVFRTVLLTNSEDVDSLAFWPGREGTPWLLVTQKDLSYVLVLDAMTGEQLARFGGTGEGQGMFHHPNGIAVIDDLVLVAERDNHRIQVLSLPDFEPLGSFGEELLQWPYGVAVDHPGEWYEVFVTDSYDSPEDEPPAPEVAANRVRHYRFRPTKAGLEVEFVRSFGEATGDGALYRVESMAIDRSLGRLYLADESRLRLNLKAYSLEGEFLGTTFGDGLHYWEPEGLIVLSCGPEEQREGYIVTADQTKPSRFLVWDRQSLAPLGGFTGEPTIDFTDGVAFGVMDGDPAGGMFYATHQDVQVVGYRWNDIAEAMGFRTDCR